MNKYKITATVKIGNEVVKIENIFEAENEEQALNMNEETLLPNDAVEDSWELVSIEKLNE